MYKFIIRLQEHGRYTFLKSEAIQSIGCSVDAFRVAASRAQKKKLIVQPKQGFFVIVPIEYRSAGCPPASWFIDDLMSYLNLPYYVCLLSAAALHGAAHQQPQVFQVISNKQLNSIRIGRVVIDFIYKKNWPNVWIKKIKTTTGLMCVSTSEATAIDLTRFINHAGYLDNIATIISELSEVMSPHALLSILDDTFCQNASLQRLGYLFDLFEKNELSLILKNWLDRKQLNYVQLLPGSNEDVTERSQKWHLLINYQIEEDI